MNERVVPDGVKVLGGKSVIDGVVITPLRKIPDERGTIYHMLKSTDSHFQCFGEVYFSSVYYGVIKGWHWHREMTLNYACITGRIKLVLFDEREYSATRNTIMEIFLGADSYYLVTIPPEVWNGFKGMSQSSIVANVCTHPHDPTRSRRLDPQQNHIPYNWDVVHE